MAVYNLLREAPKSDASRWQGLCLRLTVSSQTLRSSIFFSINQSTRYRRNQALVSLLGSIARCNSGQAQSLLERLFPDEKPDAHELEKHKKEAESLSNRERTASRESGSSVGATIRSEWVKRKKDATGLCRTFCGRLWEQFGDLFCWPNEYEWIPHSM